MVRVLTACICVLGALLAVALAPAPRKVATGPATNEKVTDPTAATQQLSEFLKFRTVCDTASPNHVSAEGREAFNGASQFLRRAFPAIWSQLDVSAVSEHSLLILWKGSDPALRPAALLSHLDVVPADEDPDTSKWTHPPFAGRVQDGYIYGRGALDLKNNVVAIMHAVNQLVLEGFRPQRSLYVALGHDEEVGGTYGATKIVERLQAEGVQVINLDELEMVLDEGGIIIAGGLPPLTTMPIAVVGTAEKHYSLVEVRTTSPGGHSSMPPVDGTAVGPTVARIILAVDAQPPIKLQPPTTDFLKSLAAVAPVRSLRWLLQHADNRLIGSLLGRVLARQPDTGAMVRTTAAVTMLGGGTARNVLPQTGNATINFRHLPGHTTEQIVEWVRGRVPVKDRGRVEVVLVDRRHTSSAISPSDGPHFRLLSSVIKATMDSAQDGILVAPYLVIGGTDSKHYAPLTDNIFRFMPVSIGRDELRRVHGTDERIHEAALITQIRFFLLFIRSISSPIA